jgi:hypothetical protein
MTLPAGPAIQPGPVSPAPAPMPLNQAGPMPTPLPAGGPMPTPMGPGPMRGRMGAMPPPRPRKNGGKIG